MNDPKIREYARRENDHILSLLLRTDRPGSGEDPLELAERNCSATARSFGDTDPLHAMALNTLTFVRMHTGRDIDRASAPVQAAIDILRDLAGHDQMLLEARLLAVQAKTATGSTAWSAVVDVFGLHPATTDQSAGIEAASEFLSGILHASVFQVPVDRLLLIMTLRQVGEQLLGESVSAVGDDEALGRNLAGFLHTYYETDDEE